MNAKLDQSDLEAQVATYIHDSIDSAIDGRRFGELACAIHGFQFRQNRPYARYCLALGATGTVDDWREIPAVPQQAFKHAELRAFSESETATTFHTSGTTGEGPGRHHFRSLSLYETALRAGWKYAGLPLKRPHFVLIPPPNEAPRSSLSHMMGTLGETASAQNWCAHLENGALKIDVPGLVDRLAQERSPVVVLGTALAFLHVFEQLKGRRVPLPAGSIAFETGGYKGSGRELSKADLYAAFATHFEMSPDAIWNEYGMTELSSQCYARGLQEPHRAPPWLRAIVIDPETGEEAAPGTIGALRLFDLANVGSVISVQTQDLARRIDDGSFELLGRDPAALPRGCSRAADEMLSVPS